MMRKLRIVLAILVFAGINLLFFDFSGLLGDYLAWLAKGQLWPAVLGLNVLALLAVIIITLLGGRLYCSVFCPLGIFQDIIGWLAGRFRKNRFVYRPARNIVRYAFLAVAVGSSLFGFMPLVAFLDPYSIYGKMAANLGAPLWQSGNNLLAAIAARQASYAFYQVEVRYLGLGSLLVALFFTLGLALLAWFKGRFWCNTVCPVGTLLGLLAKISLFKPHIDGEKCNKCGLCAKQCKSGCFDSAGRAIDYSRCVSCFDCLENCRRGAITMRRSGIFTPKSPAVDAGRRAFLAGGAVFLAGSLLKAQENTTDGGLAPLQEKNKVRKTTGILPPGAHDLAHLRAKCSGCQLCASTCPRGIIKSEIRTDGLWQPRLDFAENYCPAGCTICTKVCPTGALTALTGAEKSSLQIGRAVWLKENCLAVRGTICTACQRHCPSGAIRLVDGVPLIDPNRCLGCGACEYYCPARPDGAIYVEGVDVQRHF